MTERERERAGLVLPAYGRKLWYECTWMALSASASVSKLRVPQPLERPSRPITMSACRTPPMGLNKSFKSCQAYANGRPWTITCIARQQKTGPIYVRQLDVTVFKQPLRKLNSTATSPGMNCMSENCTASVVEQVPNNCNAIRSNSN